MRSILSVAFLRLWLGNTASGLATWALPFVLGFAVVEGRLSSIDLGIALAVRTIGFLFAVPIAGVVSDRRGPRQVILASGLAGAISLPVMMIGFASAGAWSSSLLMVGAAIAGIGQGACRPAYQAIIPEVVSAAQLQAANAAMSISVRVTSIIGPAAVSLIVLSAGTGLAFGAIALLWLISALAPPMKPGGGMRSRKTSATTNLLQDFIDGAREARRHPWFVAGLAALTVTIAAGYSVTTVLLPGISQDVFGGATLMTATATAYMVGALAGALLMARWHPVDRGWVALVGLSLYGLAPFSLLVAGTIAIPVTAYFVAGIGIEIFNVPWFTSIQNEVPQNRLSRVSSLDFLFSYGLAPAGLALMAPLVNLLGRESVLICTGILCLVIPMLAMLVPTARYFSRHAVQPSRGAP